MIEPPKAIVSSFDFSGDAEDWLEGKGQRLGTAEQSLLQSWKRHLTQEFLEIEHNCIK